MHIDTKRLYLRPMAMRDVDDLVALKYWPQFDEAEVAWVLRREEWGHGYATEAARACADWGFREFAYPYLTAMIRPENARSVRVAERLGMTLLRDDSLFDVTVVVHFVERGTFYADSPN